MEFYKPNMATPSHAQAVKSLYESPHTDRRFVFRSFSERIHDIQIDVYTSLQPIKANPMEGSFFRDGLIYWRELNTAQDFISFYDELMPCTQTHYLVLLQKELLISNLLSRLHIKARLSLEPLLMLIAELSRDLLEEFIPLFPRIVDSLVSLLESGADREPDIIEQIFTSWSYVMMYLKKYLEHNPLQVLKATPKLRYYPKEYVQQFMAEAVSFVLRMAPYEQLKIGIRRVIAEAVKEPSQCRESGVGLLLYNIMKGYSSRLHSKAERVLQLLTSETIYTIADGANQESKTILNIIKAVFEKLCETIEPKDLNLVWSCLYKEVHDCVSTGNIRHLRRILPVLVSAVEVRKGQKVSDYKPMLELVLLLVRSYITPFGVAKSQEDTCLVVGEISILMLATLDGLCNYSKSMISECATQWAPIFKSRSLSLLHFIEKLLEKDFCLLAFKSNVISAINELMEISEEEVIHLLQSFCEKIQLDIRDSDFVDGESAEALVRICNHLQMTIRSWIEKINDIAHSDVSCEIDERKVALLWGVVNCYSHMSIVDAVPSLLVHLMDAIDQLLAVNAGIPPFLVSNMIFFYEQLSCRTLSLGNIKVGFPFGNYIRFAMIFTWVYSWIVYSLNLFEFYFLILFFIFSPNCRHFSNCPYFIVTLWYLNNPLTFIHYSSSLGDIGCRMYHPELEEMTAEEVASFGDNLCHSDKEVRISTLKILCHYKSLGEENSSMDQSAAKKGKIKVLMDQSAVKKRKIEASPTSFVDNTGNNPLLVLLSIETTPVSSSTSRSITLLISKIQMDLSAGRITNVYAPLVLRGLFGILNIQLSDIWNPVLECLSVLVSLHFSLVSDAFVDYLERCLAIRETSNNANGVAGLLLQALQKIPTVVESGSRQFIPLFLKFLGYNTLDLASVGLIDSLACNGKEWKLILKEWLNLLKLMKNPKSIYLSKFIKEVLQNRLIEENDPEIQFRVLDCGLPINLER
ncbi:uncharacterized protein LOC131606025 [Vicia villosa]|uniref:uncharacterized protein LOC131606025 n=1 Tax=Vicia villosa TaxID=3911 RepID=UPI00273B1C69|nr:uncharacterized protein LOC131606025 [Vicia villosa]